MIPSRPYVTILGFMTGLKSTFERILLFLSKLDAILCPEGSFFRLPKEDFKYCDGSMVK